MEGIRRAMLISLLTDAIHTQHRMVGANLAVATNRDCPYCDKEEETSLHICRDCECWDEERNGGIALLPDNWIQNQHHCTICCGLAIHRQDSVDKSVGKLFDKLLKTPTPYHTELDCTILGKHANPAILPCKSPKPFLSSPAHAHSLFDERDGARHSVILPQFKLSQNSWSRNRLSRIGPAPHAALPARVSALEGQAAPQMFISHSAESTSDFDVVVLQSRRARKLFQRMLKGFRCPDEGRSRHYEKFCTGWAKACNFAKRYRNSRYLVPVLAMRGGIPCAAAMYSRAHSEIYDTSILRTLFRDFGHNCSGASAAILCHLIRHSKDVESKFSPLKLTPIYEEPTLVRYYKSFGCTADVKHLSFPETSFKPWTYCKDPNPQACERHVDEVFDADRYFADSVFDSSMLAIA